MICSMATSSMATKGTVTFAVGEKVIEVSVQDLRSLGIVSNGAASKLEELYDGRGKLKDSADEPFATDLANVMNAARKASGV